VGAYGPDPTRELGRTASGQQSLPQKVKTDALNKLLRPSESAERHRSTTSTSSRSEGRVNRHAKGRLCAPRPLTLQQPRYDSCRVGWMPKLQKHWRKVTRRFLAGTSSSSPPALPRRTAAVVVQDDSRPPASTGCPPSASRATMGVAQPRTAWGSAPSFGGGQMGRLYAETAADRGSKSLKHVELQHVRGSPTSSRRLVMALVELTSTLGLARPVT